MQWSNLNTLPLSHGQQALWLIYQENPQSSAYNVSLPLRFSQPLDHDLLQQALNDLLNHHTVLSCIFAEQKGVPYQQFGANIQANLMIFPETDIAPNVVPERLQHFAAQPFDLSKNVFRATLLECANQTSVVLLDIHHIVADAASLSILGRDLTTCYAQRQQGQQPVLLETAKVTDYLTWEQKLLDSPRGRRMETYWKKQLSDVPTLQLPTDYLRPPVRTTNGGYFHFSIAPDTAAQLRILAQQHKSRLFNVLLTAYQVLLHRYTAQQDIWIGTPTAVVRQEKDFQNLVGYLVNLMVVTAHFPKDEYLSFTDLLAQTSHEMFNGLFHQPYPFPLLAQQLRPQRDPSYTPLVQTSFAFESDGLMQTSFQSGTCKASTLDLPQMAGQFDLSLAITREQPLQGVFMYNTDLFKAETIARMAAHFAMLLDSIVQNPAQSIAKLNLLTLADIQQLQQWNATATPEPAYPTVHEMFAAQVEKTPQHIAVAFAEQTLTYAQLNARANQVAHALIERGVKAGTLVGICMQRTLDMLVVMLAILKSGGAYVPLDPAYPPERLGFILEDSQINILLTQSTLLPRLSAHQAQQLEVLLADDVAMFNTYPIQNPKRRCATTDLAYILFTSGSTGRPKGVMIEHRSVVCLLEWTANTFGLTRLQAVLASTSINFDLSVYELFAPLIVGGKVILAENALHLPNIPQRNEVTLINTVPSAITELLRSNAIPASVSIINLAGEPLKNALVQSLYKLPTVKEVYNLYGPSEDTTYSTFVNVPKGCRRAPTIGRPIANTRVYILDTNLQPLPPGLPGELCLAGTGLARGYLHRPELTTEKFLTVNLFGQSERIYRTGDLARWLPDGELELFGRIDHQIKLRGFRIELGEIEAVLTRHPAVKDAVVTLYTADGNARLVAYVGSAQNATQVEAELRNALKASLPDYMIPTLIMVLPSLPLNPNGKIDRAALPKPQVIQRCYAPPRDTAEQHIAAIWQDVLQFKSIGIDDNFFDLGGHSLLLMQVHSRLQTDYPLLRLVDLFGYPTVRTLSAYLKQVTNTLANAQEKLLHQQAAQNRAQQRLARQATIQQRNRRVP